MGIRFTAMETAASLRLMAVMALLSVVLCDLPVHCLHKDIKGDWLFQMSEANQDKNSIKCSTGNQNYQDSSSNFGLGDINVETPNTLKVSLIAPNIAKAVDDDGTEHHGTWTMIYDEGFEVRVKDMNLFAYSKYRASGQDGHESLCDQTFPGWHHSELLDTAQWGCWQGKKTTPVAPVLYRKFASKPVRPQSMLELPSPVEHINNHPEATWTARHYDEHEKPSRAALGNPILHYKQFEKPEGLIEESVDVSDIPHAWDWNNVNGESFVDEVVNQGNCGSCYSVATSDMISSRSQILARKTGKKPDHYKASPQSLLQQCGFYAQGCEGGFPYLAAKYAKDIGNTQKHYTADDSDQTTCPAKSELISRVHDYHYLGGYYGAATQQNMMRNIFDHGPLTVGLEVAPTMSYYQSGVYDSKINLPDQDQFERVNHAVLITGFGEHEGQKYWNIKNSWGKTWGDKGYIKIKRGVNEMNVEHMCVAAYPQLTQEYPGPSDAIIMHQGQQHSQGHAVAKELELELVGQGAQVSPITDTVMSEDSHRFVEATHVPQYW